MKVELGPVQPGELTVLDTDENGHSTQSFRPVLVRCSLRNTFHLALWRVFFQVLIQLE